jgi:hypothetical protein
MKKGLLISPFFLLFLLPLFAQKKLPAPGAITQEELQQKNCSFEPDAPALKLFEEEETEFELYTNGDTRLKTEYRTRIKIFNEAGYKYATVRIPYVTKKSLAKIKELTAYIYSVDLSGKVIIQKLGKEDFFRENVIGSLGFINFSFPNLKPGSVVEYSYTRIEQNVYQIPSWQIQDDIPIAYSSFIVITPQTSLLRNKLFGSDSVNILSLRKKNSQLRYASWYKENIPSFRPEPYMTSKADNQMRMIFFHFPITNSMISTITNPLLVWSFVGEYMLNSASFGGQIKKQIPGTETIVDSAKKLSSVPEKIKYVYNAVKKRFTGRREQSGEIDDLPDAWKEQSGTSGEINLILLNLLTRLKITSYPLMISTRDNGMVDKNFPSFGQLNGIVAVAMIDSFKYYLLDACLENQPVNCPPYNILNREALLMKPGNIDWFLISDERPLFKQSINIICDINDEGFAEGEASVQYYNYAKQKALDTSEKKRTMSDEEFLNKKRIGVNILSSNKTKTEDEDDPLYETIIFKYEPQQTNNFFFYKPSFMFPPPENPFIADKRNTDIDFGYNQEITTAFQLSFQSSFERGDLPKNIKIITPDSSFSYERVVIYSPGKINITTSFQTKKSLFIKDDYESIKDFFKKVQVLSQEEIALIKRK